MAAFVDRPGGEIYKRFVLILERYCVLIILGVYSRRDFSWSNMTVEACSC